jgi:hypothetical protein
MRNDHINKEESLHDWLEQNHKLKVNHLDPYENKENKTKYKNKNNSISYNNQRKRKKSSKK